MLGPLVNLLFILIAMLVEMPQDFRQTIIYSNLLIFVFNLMPMYPLDGGRMIKSLLKLKYDKTNVEKLVNRMSNIVVIMLTMASSILIIYFENIAILFAIMYLWIIVIKENRNYRTKKRVYDVIRKEVDAL